MVKLVYLKPWSHAHRNEEAIRQLVDETEKMVLLADLWLPQSLLAWFRE